jgi:hypothetical protein
MVAVCGGVKSNLDESAIQRSERRAVDEDDNETYIIIATRHFATGGADSLGTFGTHLGHDPPGNDQERVNVKVTRLIWCCEVTLCNRTVQVIVVSSYIMRE